MADLDRTLRMAIEKASASFRVVLLSGQRQVGKSTLLKNMGEGTGRGYVSLDNLAFRKLAREDPELFLQQNPPPVLIDEVQYAPELFPYIKIYVDEHREQKGAFWLTGSQKYKLMEGIDESLAGRIAILDLMGLSYREKIGAPFSGKPFLPSMAKQNRNDGHRGQMGEALTAREVFRRIWEGSLPEPVLDEKIDRETYYGSYVQSYIERDVKDFHNISKPIQFFDFVSSVAARTGTLLNCSSLARDIGIDVILEQDGVLYPIEIKKTANPGFNDFKNFPLAEKLGTQAGLGAVVCLQPERIALSRQAVSIPVWEI
ncbi:MAG: AAA family ATPase [Synergistaceae bacterium]|jgi:predicted AAA+ superfamily ATPase|nr:AAA family ATPase [Synergistaceae bacterium]